MSFDRVQWNYPADIAEPLAVDCDRRANQNNLSGIIKKNAKLDFFPSIRVLHHDCSQYALRSPFLF